jgi:hypothetical protein
MRERVIACRASDNPTWHGGTSLPLLAVDASGNEKDGTPARISLYHAESIFPVCTRSLPSSRREHHRLVAGAHPALGMAEQQQEQKQD